MNRRHAISPVPAPPHPGARARLALIAPPEPVAVGAPGTLRTPRLLLRPLRESDRERYLETLRAARAALDRHSPLHRDGETDEQLFGRQLALTSESDAAGSGFRRVGVLEDGTIVGAFNLHGITRGLEFKADANWWVRTDLTGRGLASEGVGALVRHALADLPEGLGLHAVQAWITRDNAASIRIAEKLGFVRAGEERSHLLTGSNWMLHDLYVRRAE